MKSHDPVHGDSLHRKCARHMASFNEIPDHLKSDVGDTWTLERGLFRGGVAVFIAAMIIGTANYWITCRAPGLTMGWLLSFACTFFMTWVMFAVMHHFSGGIHPVGNTIAVIAMIAVVMAKYVACIAFAMDATPTLAGVWNSLEWGTLVFWDFPGWSGLALAAILCRNGDFSFEDLLDIAMRRYWRHR